MPVYTKNEEIVNTLSHLLGAIFGFIAFILVVIKSHFSGDPVLLGSSIVYGLTLIELYSASTVYHALKREDLKKIAQKVDHVSVNICILGGCCIFLVGGLHNTIGYSLFGVVAFLSLLSMVLNAINVKKFRTITMACSVISSWMPLFVIHLLYASIGDGIWLLLAGGVVYTLGLIFYGIHKLYFHSIWHFFCLAGALIHFFGVYYYIL